jgi:penicillin-binding protein 1A
MSQTPGSFGRRFRALTVLALVGLFATACQMVDVPEDLTLPPLKQTSLLFDDHNHLIRSFHAAENRTVIPLDQMSNWVRDAVVAIEDERFYEHRGIDLKALVRAAYANAKSGGIVQGGSTITEQLVKNTITGDAVTLDRKINEAVIAYNLEQEHTKEWILEQYLNTVYFGEGAYGIQAASRTFFAKPASKLTLAQSALLAAVIRSPSSYDPFDHPDAAIARRAEVLAKMLSLGWIDQGSYQAAMDSALELKETPPSRYPAPYFVEEVIQWFVDQPQFGETRQARFDLLYTGGLRIYTTVNLKMQREAEDAVSSVLTEPTDPFGAMTVMDPNTGQVKAMVGGRDFFAPPKVDGRQTFSKVNLATGRGGTGRQAGSAFKPFALVAAIENGINPLQTFPAPSQIDIPLPEKCQGQDGPIWPVHNYDGSGFGNPTVEKATYDSINVVYAQIVQALGNGDPCVGGEKVAEVAKRMGIRGPNTGDIASPLQPVPSAVLGTNPVNTLEMASAYAAFPTMGQHVDPVLVRKVTDAEGNVLFEPQQTPVQVVNPGVAWTAIQIMKEVVTIGTGHDANFGRPAAGKTGTAQQWRDAWFVGFIPQLVAAVWVGFPAGEQEMIYPAVRLPHVTGGSWPAAIWHNFMVAATADMAVEDFPTPDIDYVWVRVDVTRGCLPGPFTLPGDIKLLQFVKGTEPTERCDTNAQVIPVPNVVGLDQGEATTLLESFGFRVAVEQAEDDHDAPGTVLAQQPAAGQDALQGTTVTITVAIEPVSTKIEVPNVIGLQEAEAVALLRQAGFEVTVIEKWECRPPGSCGAVPLQVWDQDPNPGHMAEQGSRITIWANKAG